jgi:hypothetical protein
MRDILGQEDPKSKPEIERPTFTEVDEEKIKESLKEALEEDDEDDDDDDDFDEDDERKILPTSR